VRLSDLGAPRQIALAGGITAALALATGLVLAQLSTPTDFKSRLAALSARADQAGAISHRAHDAPAVAANDICNQSTAVEAGLLAGQLRDQAAQLKLAVTSAELTPLGQADPASHLTALRVRMETSGAYDATLGLLDLMAKSRPQILADSVDLTPKGSTVSLAFSGRVFCAG
jgi:hypothetical protein